MSPRSWRNAFDRREPSPRKGLRVDPQRNLLGHWEECEPRRLLAADAAGDLSIADVSIVEPASGTTDASFTVELASPSSQAVTVDYSTADAGARAGKDYQDTSGTLTFSPGETSKAVNVPVIGGRTPDSGDTFTVSLSNPSGATLDSDASRATGRILPEPAQSVTSPPAPSQPASPPTVPSQPVSTPTPPSQPLPSLSVDDVKTVEGSSGTTPADFTLRLDSASDQPITVDYGTSDGTARAGVDYRSTSGSVTFQPGETTKLVSVPVMGGTTYKPTETFSIDLANPTNSVIGRGHATGTIVDSDTPGTIQLGSANTTINPDAGSATITVTRSDGTASDVGVSYSTSGGTAIAGVDYTPVSGTLDFAANQASATFSVPINSNLLLGGDKTVGITLSRPTGGGTLGAQSSATLTLSNPNSLIVSNTNDSGAGSLRQAVLTAQANGPGQKISFNIPGSGLATIAPRSPLPVVTVPVTIDATTEPGYQGTPLVELNGSKAGSDANGLAITGGDTTIKGLAINGFGASGILLQGSGGNTILGNEIGVDPTGSAAKGNGLNGISINGSSRNQIGGSELSSRNVISANGSSGIQIIGQGSSGNSIQGNRIGTDASGQKTLGNAQDGIFVDGAIQSIIGGDSADEGNLISGNKLTGVRISGSTASDNRLEGNWIGTDVTGSRALGNTFDGVFVDGAPRNSIGGLSTDAGNLISGNGGVGVQIYNASATENKLQGNLIGTDATGMKAVANGRDGVYINAASNNIVGGTEAGARNLISGNHYVGLQFSTDAVSGNVVQGNWIGTDANGRPRLGNDYGLDLAGLKGNTIGGAGAAANVVAGNPRGNVLGGSTGTNSTATNSSVNAALSVQDVRLDTTDSRVTSITLSFNDLLNASRAQDISNYRLRLAGPSGAFNARGSVPVPLKSATYDATTKTVTLELVTPVDEGVPFQLQVIGSPGRGLTDASGSYLNARRNGAGRDFLTVLNPSNLPNSGPNAS